tara:strand:+ start:63 stop:1565 length:1503 start_codon:yes stop_codon:yes gene_type:complete
MAKEKAKVTTGLDGRDNYQSPQFQVKYQKPAGTYTRGGQTRTRYENASAKLVLQFDPVTKTSVLVNQRLDSNGAPLPLVDSDKVASVGMDGKWTDINTTNFPGLDKELQNKNSRVNKDIDNQIISTYQEGYAEQFGSQPDRATTETGIGRSTEKRFQADAIPSKASTGAKEEYASPRSRGGQGNTDGVGGVLSGLSQGDLNTFKGIPAKPIGKSGDDLRYPIGNVDGDFIRFGAIEYKAKSGGHQGTGEDKKGTVFSAGGSRFGDANGRKLKIIGSTVSLPIQSGIQDSVSVGWNEDTMNPIQAAGAGLGKALLEGDELAEKASAMASDVGNASDEMKTLVSNAMVGKAVGSNVLSRMTGGIMNPNLELLFQAPQLRPFSFSFRMTPRDVAEAKRVKKIIRFFKQNMTPQRSEADLFLKAPNVFQIEYLHNGKAHPGLNRIKSPCALQSCNVDYTSEGTYMTFPDGTMVSYVMNLSFMELEPIYADEYDEVDASQESIGY